MGLGDFLKGAGHAVVETGHAVGNVAKGAAWAADPRHYDDIARGAGAVGSYVEHHPGKVWDTGFEVGRQMLKEQLKPQNLAITAGLVALTVATGGAAAPALAAEVAEGAAVGGEAIAATAATAKALDVGASAVKAGETVGSAVKAADVAGEAVKAGEVVSEAGQVAERGGRLSKFGEYADKALGTKPTAAGKALSKYGSPLDYATGGLRERAAAKILQGAGEEAPSLARQVGAAIVQGSGQGAGAPSQLKGIGDNVYAAQKMAFRGQQAVKRVGQAQQVAKGVEIAANPVKAARGAAMKEMDSRGVGEYSGYTDRGETVENLYGGNVEKPTGGSGDGGSGDGGSPWAAPYGPPSGRRAVFQQGTQGSPGQKKIRGYGEKAALWEGPRRQALGGIQAGYDWRKMDPLRAPYVQGRKGIKATEGTPGKWVDIDEGEGQGDLNEQGAPANFSPEVPKSGGYATDTQQPMGSDVFPKLTTPPKTYMATDVRERQNPIGSITPGKNDVIDASWASHDSGYGANGQGYFDMGGPGIGSQPALGTQPEQPALKMGSRTSSRYQAERGVQGTLF